MRELLEKILELTQEDTMQDEMEKHFIDRTMLHIGLVQQAAKKIVDAYPEYSELLDNAERHDASKFEEPERTPYIQLSWNKKLENEGGPQIKPTADITAATLYHVKHSSHHPEAWLQDKDAANVDPNDRDKSSKCIDASNMPALAIAEMIADWQAMSQELQKNTAREWYDKQKDVRWHFSPEQDALINKLLAVFED